MTGEKSSGGVEQYPYVRIHLCQSCGDGFVSGDEIVSLSDGQVDTDQSYNVENRRFWHRDCWRNSRYVDTEADREGGEWDV